MQLFIRLKSLAEIVSSWLSYTSSSRIKIKKK
jgi:hypothetical protein